MGFIEVAGAVFIITITALYNIFYHPWEINHNELKPIWKKNSIELNPILWIRLPLLVMAFATLIYIYVDKVGLKVRIMTRDKIVKTIIVKHLGRYAWFTVWSFSLQGIYFFFEFIASLPTQYQPIDMIISQRIADVLFEISFPTSFVVSMVVTYVLIPTAIKNELPTDNFFTISGLLMHNGNVLFMAIEMIIRPSVYHLNDIFYLFLYVSLYSVFMWI
eukprot:gene16131-21923_t